MHPRKAMLESVRAAREGRIEKRNAPFGEHVLRIPESDHAVIVKLFPGLASRNVDERDMALEQFLASPASEPYRVQRRKMGPQPRGIIVRVPEPKA